MTEDDRADLLRAARGGLCGDCAWARLVRSPRSVFVLCRNPDLPKYLPQPVLRCAGFEAEQSAES